jgi:hypothetical protein
MKKLVLLFAAASLLVVGSAFGITAAGAKTKPAAHAASKGARGPRGPKGARGPRGFKGSTGATGQAGPAGPRGQTGPQGPSGSAGTSGGGGFGAISTFNALVPFNGTESVTVGMFTLRENAGAAACTAPALTDNSAFAGKLAMGAGGMFSTPLPSATPTGVVTAAETANNLFAAVLINGGSEVSGNISDFTLPSANSCVTTGYIQGA